MKDIELLLAEQSHYYRERAGEYDDWWLRRGRYDHGQETNARWFSDATEVQAALDRFGLTGEVLELACGTGLWTERLAAHADRVTAVDGSPEMLELCRARVGYARVDYVQADLFAWEPERKYDVCFFSFWLSHVPDERFDAFWDKVSRALKPSGRVFFVDSSRHDLASAVDHKLSAPEDPTMLRRLADGREYRIVKQFHEPDRLQARLAGLGWSVEVETTREFFIHGEGRPAR
ncbi:MAG TPA: class I SAM-dependent methyltransferase [Solirubrobacteraceae bacterium]|jgi:demethylmenaquinone methyltransferase/2-methoxy-6-polyprenyl-1,4-benzoquinol methylase|nr:class I SAM-dependent methyltransferase [Solirubrobacteraceae bacterium]